MLIACVVLCTAAQRVTVKSTLNIDRSTELVEIPVSGMSYVVRNEAGVEVPSQVTHDSLLIFQSGLKGRGKATFTIEEGTPAPTLTKTKGRFAPERKDDFIWENDRVAFRVYGAALVPIDGPSNGIDVLYKRSAEMVLDDWYVGELQHGKSYHDDHGTGLDNYDVKRTLGAGGAAPLVSGKLMLNSNFIDHQILDNGPLRTTFRLTYPNLGEMHETRTFSIDAGSQLTRVEQWWSEPVTAAVGFTLRSPEQKYNSGENFLMVEEPATDKARGVYLGAVLPSDFKVFRVENEGYILVLATLLYSPEKPLVYYTGFGWEKFGGWTAATFAEYLTNFATTKKKPLIVKGV